MSDGLRGNSHPKYHAYPVQGNGRLRGEPRLDGFVKQAIANGMPSRKYQAPIPPLTRLRVTPQSPNRGHWHAWLGL